MRAGAERAFIARQQTASEKPGKSRTRLCPAEVD
jgi:hypothetical protein